MRSEAKNTPPSADLCEAEGGAARGILEPDRLRENLESLKMKNTLEILDNYLERAVAENLNIVDVLNKTFSQWNEVFADVTIASAILDRVLHHCTVINIKGESFRLKERKEFMRQKQQIVNTLFEQGST